MDAPAQAQPGESGPAGCRPPAEPPPRPGLRQRLQAVRRLWQHGAELTHFMLLLIGTVAVALALALGVDPEFREQVELHATHWLTARQIAATGMEPEPLGALRASVLDPGSLTLIQAHLTQAISQRYRVGPEPVALLVQEADQAGRLNDLDPSLILAVMAVESRFNPFAQSHKGAQGLMQVMTEVHADKYELFGGRFAAFDPRSNLRVGVRVLREYVQRAGSVRAGLKWYVGAAQLKSDGGYSDKVLREYRHLYRAAYGHAPPAEQERRASYPLVDQLP